jgi:phage terminase large subunit-like protein
MVNSQRSKRSHYGVLAATRLCGHDGSPVARRCIGNLVGHYDRRGNINPNKARYEANIDCAIATIMALGASIATEAQPDNVIYNDHGLLAF